MQTYSILVADDDCTMRDAYNVMVRQVPGFEICDEAANGKEAVALFKNLRPDILFIDNKMPVMSGLSAIKEIRKIDDDVTIYLLSSFKNFNLASEALKLGVKEYLLKPLSLKTFQNVLQDFKLEKSNKYNVPVMKMEEVIGTRDFRAAYYAYSEVMNDIYSKYGDDPERLTEAYRYLGRHMLGMIGGVDEQSKTVQEMLALDESITMNPRKGEMWLFSIMDYVFKERSKKRYPTLASVLDFIDGHITEDIGLNQIIENCAISQGYLSRIFKDQFKVSVMEYIHMRKIQLAKCRMYLSNDSISKIAFQLGYSESSYFRKVFKKYEHVTLQEYKNKVFSTNRKGEVR